MSRGISAPIKALVAARMRAHLWFLVEFSTVYGDDGETPLRFTNFNRNFIYDTKIWQALGGMTVSGLGENLEGRAAATEIVLPSLDAALQAKFLADEFRGSKCWVTVLVQTPGDSIVDADQLWQTRFTCGADAIDEDTIRISLGSEDAVRGTEVPRRQVSEIGCQLDYMKTCPYRGHRVYTLTSLGVLVQGSLRTVVHATCSKQLQDIGTDPGCRSHFPPVLNPTWTTTNSQPRTIRRPLPHDAWPGETPGRVVV
jgi:hypothetical protein